MSQIILHSYWRSSAAYRVRIALNLKNLMYLQVGHDLRAGEQQAQEYLAVAPHGLVPAIEYEGRQLIESPAIIEWLDARWPTPALLPPSADDAAVVRAMVAIIACDIHPINNLRVLNTLRRDFGASEDAINIWVAEWITRGFTALEVLVNQHRGTYAFGDTPSMADCFLVPQFYNAERFGVETRGFPQISAVVSNARLLSAFVHAEPASQPDADKS